MTHSHCWYKAKKARHIVEWMETPSQEGADKGRKYQHGDESSYPTNFVYWIFSWKCSRIHHAVDSKNILKKASLPLNVDAMMISSLSPINGLTFVTHWTRTVVTLYWMASRSGLYVGHSWSPTSIESCSSTTELPQNKGKVFASSASVVRRMWW